MADRRSTGRLAALAVVAFLALCGVASALTVQQVAQGSWVEARTANFVVLTDAGEARARYLAQNLEDFRRLVIKATNLDIKSNPLPFHIIALTSAQQLVALIDTDDVFGAFRESYRGGLAVVNLSARAPDGTDSLSISYTPAGPVYRARQNMRTVGMDGVFHEYVHYLLEIDAKRRYPLWFHEGYAEYLSTFDVSSDGRYKVGAPPMHRVLALEKTRRIPVGSLLNAKGYQTGHEDSDFNAESWLLVHYLMADPARREKLYAFLDRLEKPMIDAVPAFEEVFGESADEFATHLRQYARVGKYDTEHFDRSTDPLPEPATRSVPGDEVREELAYTVLYFSPKLDKGTALLNEALAANPLNQKARALLAWIALIDNQNDRSQSIIEQAGSAVDGDADLLDVQGDLFLRRAIDLKSNTKPGWENAVAVAKDSFQRALALDPDDARAMSGLARLSLIAAGEPSDQALALIDQACALLPMDQEMELIRAHILLSRGEGAEAVKSYQHVVAWGRNPETVRQARERLDAIYAFVREHSKQTADPAP